MTTRQKIFGAVVLGVTFLTCTAQAEEMPDLRGLGEKVARIVITDEIVDSGVIPLLIRNQLNALPSEFGCALFERLNEAEGGWQVLPKPMQIMDMPGKWRRTRSQGRVNRTHVLIDIKVSGVGGRRRVAYSRVRGNLYGFGQEILFEWKNGSWQEKILTTESS